MNSSIPPITGIGGDDGAYIRSVTPKPVSALRHTVIVEVLKHIRRLDRFTV